MKKLLYIFTLAFLSSQLLFSQPPCVDGINTPLGSTINNWDWTIEKFEVYIITTTK